MPDRPKSAEPAFGATRAVRPLAGPFAARGAWVLGTERLQRRSLQLILVAAGVYGLSLLAQWNAVTLGMADGEHAAWLAAFIGAGVCAVFAAFRSGVAARLGDPALALPQIGGAGSRQGRRRSRIAGQDALPRQRWIDHGDLGRLSHPRRLAVASTPAPLRHHHNESDRTA